MSPHILLVIGGLTIALLNLLLLLLIAIPTRRDTVPMGATNTCWLCHRILNGGTKLYHLGGSHYTAVCPKCAHNPKHHERIV